EMHGLHQRLSERRALFRFRKTDAVSAQIYRDQKELLIDVAPRNRRCTGFPGEFPGCSRCLRFGSIPDGAGLCQRDHVSRSETVASASGEGIVALPFQSEVLRQNAEGGLGVCSLCLCLDWPERALRLGALSRVPRQPRIPEDSATRRTGPGAGQSRPLAYVG